MAHLTDLAYDHLAWCTTWYLREETLKAAFTALVNSHDHLPLSQLWGSGILLGWTAVSGVRQNPACSPFSPAARLWPGDHLL